MSDAFSELEVFTRVVELGGFSRAASNLRLTPSGVSRIVTRLEERLGVRLLNRTTRSISLTQEGADYFERSVRILADLNEANAVTAKSSAAPRGRLRVDVPIIFADFIVGPALPKFLNRFPELEVDLTVRDRLIDPTAEGVDVVLRLAPPRDSDLLARKLGTVRSVLVASPKYLSKHGRPKSLDDLGDHLHVPYLSENGPLAWRFNGGVTMAVRGRVQAASGNVLTHMVVGGMGIAQTYEPHIKAAIERGDVEVLLPSTEPDPRPVHALFARQKAELPKVRVFLEFFAELFSKR
ncbi:MAG: LysR family transcriptional regulator [Archangium sp.]